MCIHRPLLVTCLIALLGACSTDESDPAFEPDPQHPNPLSIQIMGATHVHVDSDNNDSQASVIRNNDFSEAQAISAPATTIGFLSYGGTGDLGDRFAIDDDKSDFFKVSLLKNDALYLTSFDQPGVTDLDLYLYDATKTLLKYSDRLGGDEFIRIDKDGDYYISITAHTSLDNRETHYSSKYQLTIAADAQGFGAVGTNMTTDFSRDHILVRYKPVNGFSTLAATSGKGQHNWQRFALTTGSVRAFQNPLSQTMPLFLHHLQKSNPDSYTAWTIISRIKALRQSAKIEGVEPNYPVKAFNTSDDPYWPYQWYLQSVKHAQAISLLHNMPQNEVIVAVIDSGVYLQHEDLRGRLVPGFDFISDLTNACDGDGIDGNPDDPGDTFVTSNSTYHGTHVAGIIAANRDNGIGIAGLSNQAQIMPLRVLGCAEGNNYDIMQAIRFAAGLPNDSGRVPDRRADIINLSLGNYSFSQAMQDLINQVARSGIFIVAAAGNDSRSSPAYPASYQNVISVSATNSMNALAYYSNFGNSIDIAAPGGDMRLDIDNNGLSDGILSLSASGNLQRFSDYRNYQGTSMATPVVSAIIAMMKSVNNALTPADFSRLMRQGLLSNQPEGNRSPYFGYGLIDAEKAVYHSLIEHPVEAILYSNVEQLHLSPSRSEAWVLLSQSQGADITLTDIQSNQPWLQMYPTESGSRKPGQYRVMADFDQIPLGQQTGQIDITADNGQTLTIDVIINHRQSQVVNNDSGLIWLLLVDPETQAVQYQFSAEQQAGEYNFILDGVMAANYLIYAGTDIDNDQQLCSAGELCTAYPGYPEISPVYLDGQGQTIRLSLGLFTTTEINPSIEMRYKQP